MAIKCLLIKKHDRKKWLYLPWPYRVHLYWYWYLITKQFFDNFYLLSDNNFWLINGKWIQLETMQVHWLSLENNVWKIVFTILSFLGGSAALLLINTSAWLNLPSLLTFKTNLACCVAGLVVTVTFWCCLYLFWVHILHLPYHIPFIRIFIASAEFALIVTAL